MDANELLAALQAKHSTAVQRRSDALLALGEAAYHLWKQFDQEITKSRLLTERSDVERSDVEIRRIEIAIEEIKKAQVGWKPAEASHAS